MRMVWLKRHLDGFASSLDNSCSRRLLRSSGPEALPIRSSFKKDSTLNRISLKTETPLLRIFLSSLSTIRAIKNQKRIMHLYGLIRIFKVQK